MGKSNDIKNTFNILYILHIRFFKYTSYSFLSGHPSEDPRPSAYQKKLNKIISFIINSYPDLLTEKNFERIVWMQPDMLKGLIKSKKYSKWVTECLVDDLVSLNANIADYVIKVHPELAPEDYEAPLDESFETF